MFSSSSEPNSFFQKNDTNNNGPEVWAIGGGKGGVGKSFISSSLALNVAKFGHNVILIDLDLGSANLHTCLGEPPPEKTLSGFISGRKNSLEEIITPTKYRNLSFISGFNDSLNSADLDDRFLDKIKNEIKNLKQKIVILDLGAGTSNKTLDFFLMADKKILTIIPEPTSVENSYRFIKSAYYKKLKESEQHFGVKNIINEAMDFKNKFGIKSPNDLIRYIYNQHPFIGKKLYNDLSKFQLEIIINQIRSRNDFELGFSVKSICNKYFGLNANYLGPVNYDNTVWQALRKKKPAIIEYPFTELPNQFLNITKKLLDHKKVRVAL